MRSGPRSRNGFVRPLVEFVVGTLVVLRSRGRDVRPDLRWRPGATEFHLPEALRRTVSLHAPPAVDPARPSRLMRPLLVFGFLVAFASVGVGFGGLAVDPDAAFAPGTPSAPVVVVTAPASDGDTARSLQAPEPTVTRDDGLIPATGLNLDATSEPTATDEVPSTATQAVEPAATEEPATPTAEVAAATVPPTPTAVPPTAAPAPQWNYHPVTQLTEAEVRAAAASAGWPAELMDQVVQVAWCESSYRPNAANGWAYGIMQLVPNWFDYAGVDFNRWTDPVANLQVAYAAYKYDITRGNAPWEQWVCKPTATVAAASTPTPEPTETSEPPAALGGQ